MLITLILQTRMYQIRLPEKVRGQYFIKDTEEGTKSGKIAEIEADGKEWKLKSNRNFYLYDEEGQKKKEIRIEAGKLYPVVFVQKERQEGYILTETFTQDRCSFTKYQVMQNCELHIGVDKDSNIRISNAYVTAKHATLTMQDKVWILEDKGSTNGTYVNGRKLTGKVAMHYGDVIFIVGCKIIVGKGFFAINNPDGSVKISHQALKELERCPIAYKEKETQEREFYYKAPYFPIKEENLVMKIEAPPSRDKEDTTPIMLTLAPSMMMGVASFASGLVTTMNTLQNNGNILASLPTLLMTISMLAGMIVFPFIMKIREKKQKRENEKIRWNKYLKYLHAVRSEIYKSIERQENCLREKFPPILQRLQSENFWNGTLWGITDATDEFLRFRLGVGKLPLEAGLVFPEERFTVEEDALYEEMQMLKQEERELKNVPVCLPLLEKRICGIAGNRTERLEMLQNMLLQLTALQGYDEVKLVFIGEERDLQQIPYISYFPHIWDNRHKERYLAVTPEEARSLSGILSKAAEKKDCYFVVFTTNRTLADSCSFLADALKEEESFFRLVAFYDKVQDLPVECDTIIEIGEECSLLEKEQMKKAKVFKADGIVTEKAQEMAEKIISYELDLNKGRYELPEMLTFLQMFETGTVEHLNIQSRWKESNPALTLRTPVGVRTDGELFYLDLHERAHGPHGLVAGMTGSGKSEFIITFILSLAVNYHPDEVAFILIDYKGGGLAGAFDNEEYRLPHLAGTITNLDGASITRSLVSIQSELRRRQAMFNEARNLVNEGTMDIYKYQKLYRNGIVKEPLPHLFIISDEFAELKSQQPEFMEQLISAARIGRSLGVHLILATQKPNGVVNEQIWANSKFKICLKVQDKADSNDMLKRPDAAELIETGRFYLQVGYNELFELGQSAWCGAPYTQEADMEAEESIAIIDNLGRVVEKEKWKKKSKQEGKAAKQIVEILRYIAQAAQEEGVKARNLWLPEMKPVIDCNMLAKKYAYTKDKGYVLAPVVGELDDPYNQKQEILTVPFTENGNALVYGSAGSGKNTFLMTMLYSLYRNHDGSELNTYLLDFGAETLSCFAEAPQVGEVILDGETVKMRELMQYLKQEMKERKKILSAYAGDYRIYCEAEASPRPCILVVINDYANFQESYEAYDEDIYSLTREGTKYGIYFILTVNSANAIRYKMAQNFNLSYVLQLNDRSDYFNILGNTGGVFPQKYKGRGILRRGEVYEFQTAYTSEEPEKMVIQMKNFCHNLRSTYEGMYAQKVENEKQVFDFSSLQTVEPNKIPYGMHVEQQEIVYWNMYQESILQVIAKEEAMVADFAQGLAQMLCQEGNIRTMVLDITRTFKKEENGSYELVWENIEDALSVIYDILVDRHNTYKSLNGRFPDGYDNSPIVLIIANLEKVWEILTEDGRSKLRNMLLRMKGELSMAAVVCDSVKAAARSMVTGFRKERCAGNGIFIGADPREQYVMFLDEEYRRKRYGGENDNEMGFLIKDGIPHEIRLLQRMK